MTNKEKLLNFIDYIKTLEKEPYAKIIDVLPSFNFSGSSDSAIITIEEDKPNSIELQSFVSIFRDCFEKGKSSHVYSENINLILREYIKDDAELYAEWERINNTWDNIRNSDTNIILDNRVDGDLKKYKTLFDAYEEITYGLHLHRDPLRKDRLENLWFMQGYLKHFFYVFIEHGYKYLLALKALIEIAISRNLIN